MLRNIVCQVYWAFIENEIINSMFPYGEKQH